MRKINKLGRRAAALVLAVGLTLSTAAPVLAADADEVQTPAAQTEQQETDTEADEAAALPELSEDREVQRRTRLLPCRSCLRTGRWQRRTRPLLCRNWTRIGL